MNRIKTAMLLAAMTALFIAIGQMIGGQSGMLLAFGLALAMNFVSYWFSDSIVLRMHNAQEVEPQEASGLYAMVARLAQRGNLPMPRVYIIPTQQPNAFATGRNPQHAAVAATEGLLRMLNADEIEAVMAHELAHVAHRDTLTMTVTATLAGAIGMLANMAMFMGGGHRNDNGEQHAPNPLVTMAMMLLAPLAASLVQAAISRSREYEADRLGAELCGNPNALASALLKIQNAAQHLHNPVAEANPATAHLYISNPLSGRSMLQLFSTHPATEDRVAALREMRPTAHTPNTPQPSLAPRKTGLFMPSSRRRSGPWGN